MDPPPVTHQHQDTYDAMDYETSFGDQPSSVDNSHPGSAGGARSKAKKTVGFSHGGDLIDTLDRPRSFNGAAPEPGQMLPAVTDSGTNSPGTSADNSPGHSRVGSGDNLFPRNRSHLPPMSREVTDELRAALSLPVPVSKPRPALRRGESALSTTTEGNDGGADTPQTVMAREAYERGKKWEKDERVRSAPTSRRSSPIRAQSGRSANTRVDPDIVSRKDFGVYSDTEEESDEELLLTRSKASQHAEAARLVKSHKPGRLNLHNLHIRAGSGSRSGATTPLEEQQDAMEYVPRPNRYRGGVLGALLKLYNQEQPTSPTSPSNRHSLSLPQAHIREGSFGTDSALSTPQPSPPTSGTTTPVGRKSSRSWYSSKNRNQSTSSLARLIGSSSIAASPAVSGLGEEVAERLKQREAEKKKRPGMGKRMGSANAILGLNRRARAQDEHYITIHIANFIQRQKYLLKLCRALMQYGAPTHRLEEYMRMSARVLEIEAQFLYIPGSMIVSFDDADTHTTEVKLVRVAQGLDLGKLRDTHEIYKEVVHDRMKADEAEQRLDEVIKRPVKHRPWALIPVYGLASASVGPFAFGARVIDLPIAFLLGCILGILQLIVAPQSDLYANVFEISAAVITSFLARAFGSIPYKGEPLFCFSALAQSSIALILPGYIVLCASLELQSRSIVAGSVRMVYAIIYSLFLGFGITIGTALYGIMDHNATSKTTCDGSLGHHYFFIAVPVFTLCLIVINQAKWKQAPVMMIIAFAGYVVNYFSSQRFQGNTQVSQTLGALAIGVMANTYSRLGQRVENKFLDLWEEKLRPIWRRMTKEFRKNRTMTDKIELVENGIPLQGDGESIYTKHTRRVGYGLAAAAMLPAIFVQVPSGLAVSGSLISGLASANQIVGNSTNGTQVVNATTVLDGSGLNSIAFNVGYSVIQVAIGITVGLFLSAIVVYPLGKRRSGLFSF